MMSHFEKTAQFETGHVITTHGRTVTETDIVNFAGISGDFHPAHLDVERMKNSPYGRPIAHGDLVLSLALGLLWQCCQRPNAIDDSFDRIRFPKPTFSGDTLTVRAELTEQTEPSPETPTPGTPRRETWNVTVTNQHGETVCAFVRTLQLW